jgi:serine/threonine protein kinase
VVGPVNAERLRPGDPERIADFRLLGRIGSGGMGVVYLAAAHDGQYAALKVIRSDLADDQDFRARFAREIEAAQRVRSPVTAGVLAADPSGDPPWVAFDYIEGPNLADVIARGVPRLSAGLGILSGVAEALVAIHGAGVIHRDLKPGNVLVAPGGVMVIDFGIAAALDATTLTRSGLIGTPGWLAPEQIRGERVTFATDSFAWGTLAMYTTTGRHPFGGPDQAAAAYLYRIVNDSPDLDGLPPQLYGIVSAALAQDPAHRPDADALLAALLPVGASDAETAPLKPATPATALVPSSTPTEVSPGLASAAPARKGQHWFAAAVAGLLAVTLVAVVVALLGHSRTHSSASSTGTTTSPAAPTTSTSPSTSTSPTTAAATTTPTTKPVQPVALPVSVSTCPTEFGIEGQTAPTGPSSMNAPVSVANDVSGYSNGFINMLAPAGWSCIGIAGADGGKGLDAYPHDQAASALQTPTGTPSDALAVSVQIPSQGTGPASNLACSYFPTAASGSGVPCQTPPPREIIHRGGAHFVEVEDPPGVAGLLTPSGGAYAANGVVVWDPSTQYAAAAVCTLPDQQHQICTALLNDFLKRYGALRSSAASAAAATSTTSITPAPTASVAPSSTATTTAGPMPLFTAGCTNALYQPRQIHWCTSLCSSYMTNITWTSWTRSSATGHGTWLTNDGIPDCARGTWTAHYDYPVSLSVPGPCGRYGTIFLESNLYGPLPDTGCAG